MEREVSLKGDSLSVNFLLKKSSNSSNNKFFINHSNLALSCKELPRKMNQIEFNSSAPWVMEQGNVKRSLCLLRGTATSVCDDECREYACGGCPQSLSWKTCKKEEDRQKIKIKLEDGGT